MIPALAPALFMPKASAAYTGPGDISPGAKCWGGLRAYSAATAGTQAIRLRRDSDNLEQDFNTLSNGDLDVASITTFKGAANLFVTALYDKSGNGLNWTQPTVAAQPAFILNGLGTHPVMRGNGTFLLQVGTFSLVTPWCFATVAQTTDATTLDVIGWDTAGNSGIAFSSGTSAFTYLNSAATASVTTVTSTWYSLLGGTDTTNAQQTYANGVAGGGAGATSVGFTGTNLNYMTRASGVQPLTGSSVEFGLFPFTPFVTATVNSLTANARTYWGI
jgi:hypothetical protein